MNILVMGIGNLLLQDEGAGVRVIEALENKYVMPAGVELLDGGTSGIELLYYIEGRDVLILVDVVRNGGNSGTLYRFEGEEVPALFQKKISPHQLGISDLLATAKLIDKMPEKVVLFGIEPKCIDTGLELTAEVTSSIPEIVEQIADEIRSLGLQLEIRKSGFFEGNCYI